MDKNLKYILEKMCEYVNIKYNNVDFKSNIWFYQHQWTLEQQKDFEKWLNEHLKNNKNIREYFQISKKMIKFFVNQFIFLYGWKLKK